MMTFVIQVFTLDRLLNICTNDHFNINESRKNTDFLITSLPHHCINKVQFHYQLNIEVRKTDVNI